MIVKVRSIYHHFPTFVISQTKIHIIMRKNK